MLAGRGRWLLPAALIGYVTYVTLTWRFPDWAGMPFWAAWVPTVAFLALGWRLARGPIGPVELTAIVAVATMLTTDATTLWSQGMRDLFLYLRAGDEFRAAAPVYMTTVLAEKPEDLTEYPFLYPPLTLPIFGLLAALPSPLVAGAWVAGSTLAALAGLRLIGLSWRWAVLFLAWTPFFQGLFVGNVAVPLFLLFALGYRYGAGLVVPAVFKLYSGFAALWLVREHRWRPIVAGVLLVALAALVTLPLVGPDAYVAWFEALRLYRRSQELLPEFLYGLGLPRYLPGWLFILIAGATLLVALTRGGREGLARLGLATVVASPSAFAHGFLVALPAFLALRGPWFWLAVGITSCAPGAAWWLAVGLVVAGWALPSLRRDTLPVAAAEPLHPLAGSPEPWPAAPTAGGARSLPRPAVAR